MEYALGYVRVLYPSSIVRSVSSVGSSITRRVLLPPLPPQRAFRVCNHDRSIRKGVVASTLSELISKCLDTLLIVSGILTFVLEEDGTVVDTEEFFQSLEDGTTLMVLKEGQKWTPVKGRNSFDSECPKKKGIAKVTFDLYKLNPKDFIGCLNIRATFYDVYSVTYDIQCMKAKNVLRKLFRVLSYLTHAAGQFLLFGSTYMLQLTGECDGGSRVPDKQSTRDG
ncbi:cell death activator CIDE-A [Protopterus annectens]|uniref:cell death activator CIDE-A n=1 Tax=Protopterus annectens TaxID=7888 RepID=UPI001CFA27CA|nr:cell death activator CIDE-A [Protopterus annectens]